MGTVAHTMPEARRPSTWLWGFLKEELAPYPGRTQTMARIVLAVTLIMIVCNTFRLPYAFVGGIYALALSRESPRATLNSAGKFLLLTACSLAYVLISVQFVISDPMLHFLWVIGSLFLAFYALAVVTNYPAFVGLALVLSVAVTIWDRRMPAERNVEDTFWLALVALIAIVVTSGVELAFGRVRPGDDIVLPVAERLAAVHGILSGYADRNVPDAGAAQRIVKLATAGTSTLRRALRRSDYSPLYTAQMGGIVALVGRLVDIAAALTELNFEPSGFDQAHLQNLAEAVMNIRADLMNRRIPGPVDAEADGDTRRAPLLRELENTVALIPQVFAGYESIDEYQTSSDDVSGPPLIAADAFVNPEHLKFALRGSLTASACYFIYNSLDWPGMGATVMLTCFLTAFSTIGTSRQRQVLRFGGFVGGLLLAMGAQVFILPGVDSIGGFTVLVVLVTALAAWFMTSSPRLSFFGLQLGAAFFVVHMQKFARETSLAVARDRIVGVFVGLLMMWLIFDHLWSVSASVEIRRVFTSTLRLLAQFTREPDSADTRAAIRRSAALRETINSQFDKVRSLADGVLLEFGDSRRDDLLLRERIRRWQPQLRALFLMRSATLRYRFHLPGFELPEAVLASLQEYDECSARLLESMADRVDGKTSEESPASAESSTLAGQVLEICRTDEATLLLSEQGARFVPLLRRIDHLTTQLADQITLEN